MERNQGHADPASRPEPNPVGEGSEQTIRVRDVVCGMSVDPIRTAHHAAVDGREYHFCSHGCRTKFVADPARFLQPIAQAPTVTAPPGARFTCPMHPEVEQVGPGTCPKCGMALDAVEPDAEVGSNPELADMTRRLVIGGLATIPVFALAMGEHLVQWRPLPPAWSEGLQLVLASVVVLWAGAPFFARGWSSVRSGHLNMFTLIALGTGASWSYSVVATLVPGVFPAGFRGTDGTVGVYFEAAAVIVVLVLLGQVLELRARETTGDAIRGLLDLSPKTARRLDERGDEGEVPLATLAVGDRLRVRPGETIPTDGVVVEGQGAVDEAMVTGESMPVTKDVGASVIGGTINGTGTLVITAQKVGRDTVLAQIVALVGKAQRSRAPIQGLADRVAGVFVPAVLASAVLAFAVWAALGPEPRLAHALIAAVSVLIIACPCALGLATPMSIVVGVGRGAQAGILVRDADALERLARVDTVLVDKTGTLTEGHPRVVALCPRNDLPEDDLLRFAASLETPSEHPIAQAIRTAAADRELRLGPVSGFDGPTGQGVLGEVEGRAVRIGSESFLAAQGIETGSLHAEATALRRDGTTVVVVAVDGQVVGLIGVADPVKASSKAVLAALARDGLRVVMVTGDSRATADAIAKLLGIDAVEADVMPEGKARVVSDLQKAGRVVAMAGDGINDAPALAAADVGIAMGTGTDVAMQSAGMTLLGGDLTALLRARHLSRATMANIRQNLGFAFFYNVVGIPVAAGVLYPVFGVTLSPMLAALAMAFSSVCVIGNALRLRRIRFD